MDLEKIKIRQDLSRMVYNYCLTGKINNFEAKRIVAFIDSEIGGGGFTGPVQYGDNGCKVYIFPVKRREQDTPVYQAPNRQDNTPEPPRPDLWDYLNEHGIRLRPGIKYVLKRLGAYDLESIAALSASEIAKYRNVGEKSIADLRAVLQSKGLDLKE
jgi:hypothetical protein